MTDYRDSLARRRDTRRKSENHETMQVMAFYRSDETADCIEVWVPARYEVCSACSGKGKYVNPSIDSQGISSEEMHEMGDDFREDYMSGMYDVTCDACDGNRVELKPDRDRMSEELTEEWFRFLDDEAASRAEEAYERRMGC